MPVKKTSCVATASPEGFQEPSSAGGFNRRGPDGMEAHGGQRGPALQVIWFCLLDPFLIPQ